MKTGDIYFDYEGNVCIHLDKSEPVFNEAHWNTHADLHATLEYPHGLCYRADISGAILTGVNILDVISDPIIQDYLREQCQSI